MQAVFEFGGGRRSIQTRHSHSRGNPRGFRFSNHRYQALKTQKKAHAVYSVGFFRAARLFRSDGNTLRHTALEWFVKMAILHNRQDRITILQKAQIIERIAID